ncbi:MAG: SusC/RagA family TonB-linked outer membrane protein [Gemmatimonadota bacterium]
MSLSLRPKWLLAGLIALAAAVGARDAAAQGAVVTGKVTTSDGAPLGGAVVQIRELATSAATNVNGVYTIHLGAGQVRGQTVAITARAIGFGSVTKNIVLSAGTVTADFTLAADPLKLDELVVTGVAEATSTKKMTFSVGRVDEETLQNVPSVNPLGSLTGKVSGARVVSNGTPGSETAVRLRGATSLTPGASQQPLLVVDGIITKGSLADINAEDIESIEVLKGAASAGIYGSDAAAGVINIITRRGRNAPDSKTVVTLRGEYGLTDVQRKVALNQATNCLDRNGNDFPRRADGTVNCPNRSIFYDQDYPAAAPFRYQQDNLVGNGQFYTGYLSLGRRQGGTNFQASVEQQGNQGIIDVPGVNLDGFKRTNVRLNVDQVVSPTIDISVGGFYNTSSNQLAGCGSGGICIGTGSPFFGALFVAPDVDLLAPNTNGQPFRVDASRLGATPSTDINPLYTVLTTNTNENRNRVQGSFRGRWRPTEWFSFDVTYGYDRSKNEFRNFVDKGTLNVSGQATTGTLFISNFETTAQNVQLTGALTRKFGDLNTILRGSYLYEDEFNNYVRGSGSKLQAFGVPTLDNTSTDSRSVSSFQTRLRARNLFGQLSLDWREMLILDGLVRRDNSSLFGQDNRSRTFYRVSGAWRITQLARIPGIDELRVRASRGTAGLRPPFEAQYETFNVSATGITPGVLGNRNLKPAYSEENEFGVNIDFLRNFSLEYTYADKKTKDQVLAVPLSSVAGFSSQWRNAGQLNANTHELALGVLLINKKDLNWRLNITGDRTRQKVASLDAAPFVTGAGAQNCNNSPTQSNCLFIVKPGESFGAMYGTRWVRSFAELLDNPANRNANLDPNNYVVNPDGLLVLRSQRGTASETPIKYVAPDGATQVKIGDANPDFTLGFNTTFQWKGLSLYGLVDWTKGGDIYNLPQQWLMRSEFRSAAVDQRSRPGAGCTPQGGGEACQRLAAAYYAKINDANSFSDYFVEDGSYARLRELRLDYTFNNSQLAGIGLGRVFDRVRVGVVGRNLLTWTNYSGLDPEASSPGTANGRGTGSLAGAGDAATFRFDNFGYPNFRTFSFVLELGF